MLFIRKTRRENSRITLNVSLNHDFNREPCRTENIVDW